MAKIFFKKINKIFEVDIDAGKTLLDAAKKINIPEITADCKGNCACGTCHVHIDDKWIDIIEPIYVASLEPYLLEKSKNYNEKLSRLCCQVEIEDAYDGLIVHLL